MDTFNEHNPNAPWNQIEVNDPEIIQGYENFSQAYESGHVDEIFKIINEARQRVDELVYCLESVESGLTGKAKRIKELLK
jgi:FKBP-type peptidyl-prolyl cis-trans isomerase (trigger factor)